MSWTIAGEDDEGGWGAGDSVESQDGGPSAWRGGVATALQSCQESEPVGGETESQASVRLLVSVQGRPPALVLTKTWPTSAPLAGLRALLARALNTAPHTITMTVGETALTDEACLADVGVTASSSVSVEATCEGSVEDVALLRLAHTGRLSQAEDIITVHLYDEDGGHRAVVVSIEWQCSPKPWLGGLVHRRSGRRLHHAATMTSGAAPALCTLSRGQQTCPPCHVATQTLRDQGTQTCHFPSLQPHCRVLTPFRCPPYPLHMVVTIQRAVRGWLARRRQGQRRASQPSQLQRGDLHCTEGQRDFLRSTEGQEDGLHRSVGQRDGLHSTQGAHSPHAEHPPSLRDMHQTLALWCARQTDSIRKSTAPGKERTKALSALLTRETAILRRLHEQRVRQEEQRAAASVSNFLDSASQPQRWPVAGGGHVAVVTPNSGPLADAAAVTKQLLHSCSVAERLVQLRSLASAVDRLQAGRGDEAAVLGLKRALTALLGRALQLLSSGSRDAALAGLRKRIHSHVLHLLHLVLENNSPAPVRVLRPAGALPLLST